MPFGCFILEIDDNSKAKLRSSYFPTKNDSIEINDRIILKIRVQHSEKKIATITESNYSIVSIIEDFKRNKANHQLIFGLILKPNDNPTNFKEQLKIALNEIMDNPLVDDSELSEKLKNIYEEFLETPTVLLNLNEIEERMKERIKDLNKQGKFEEAKKMIDLIKKVPKKLYQANKNAQKAIEKGDLDAAERELKKAVKYAEEIGEKEQANMLSEKVKMVKQIPKLKEKRKEELKKARESLRNEDFEKAYKHFKNAAELSKKLLDPYGAEEYLLKAEALSKFSEVHKRFHK
ncbi:MAG: hypothetical protein ACTSRZ_16070 [Promethearchaeota archaeon]